LVVGPSHFQDCILAVTQSGGHDDYVEMKVCPIVGFLVQNGAVVGLWQGIADVEVQSAEEFVLPLANVHNLVDVLFHTIFFGVVDFSELRPFQLRAIDQYFEIVFDQII
jgi:hypothetical protein